LFCDPWESLLLTPKRGLADRLGLDRHTVDKVARRLWVQYSSAEATEEAYWNDLALALDLQPHKGLKDLVKKLEPELLLPNPRAFDILDRTRSRKIQIGVVSDNTAFWYGKQAQCLNLDNYLAPQLLFLSYLFHQNKDAGLFGIAATRVEPTVTLVVDDKQRNIERAQGYGFHAHRYSLTDGELGYSTLMMAIRDAS